jgi:hypothetical protein
MIFHCIHMLPAADAKYSMVLDALIIRVPASCACLCAHDSLHIMASLDVKVSCAEFVARINIEFVCTKLS